MDASTKASPAPRRSMLFLLVLLGGFLLARSLFTKTVSAQPELTHAGTAMAPVASGRTAVVPIPADLVPAQAEVVPSQADTGLAIGSIAPSIEISGNTGFAGSDRAFLETAARVNDQEYEISSKVLSHLIYPEVREYACAIIDRHDAVHAALTGLATRKGVTLPVAETISQRVRGRDDGTLDRRYVNLMAEGNKDVVEMFKQAAQSGDAEVADFAQKMLPMVQNNLNTARNLEKLRE